MSSRIALPDGVLWQPHAGPQARFLASDAYEVLYGGAAGGGKTDALIWDQVAETEHPKFRGLLLRKTFPQLREVMDRMHGWLPKLGAAWSEREKRWEFPSGATIMTGFGSTFEEVQQYGGFEFSCVSYDELGNVPDERVWTFLMSRNRSTAEGLLLRMRASANPGQAGHAWVKKRFITPCPRDGSPIGFADKETGLVLTRAFFFARIEDNPSIMRDPTYIAKLNLLDETTRKQLRDGDWSVGAGMALGELAESVHLIPPFTVPKHWRQFGAFDWGFNHPYVFQRFAADEDGNLLMLQTVSGRRRQPDEIATRICDALAQDPWNPMPRLQLSYTVAGLDCWHDHKARGENTPTIAEALGAEGLVLTPASVSRVAGLNNLRAYVQWRRPLAGALDAYEKVIPRLRFFDTPVNREITWETLTSMTEDPSDREDALKRDADDEGRGGDDAYDCARYACASRPLHATKQLAPVRGAWHPDTLAAEYELRRRVRLLPGNEVSALVQKLEADAGF